MDSCYGDVPLDEGITARCSDGVNGLSMHILEGGYRSPDRPLVLLLHGFPELAFSWRKLMPLIAARGYHVIAPDLRGYGVTTGWDGDYDGDLASFRLSSLVRDILALLAALGHQRVAAVVGHDFGSPLAAWCALLHPHIFGCVALLSAPFPGPPRRGPQHFPPGLLSLQKPRLAEQSAARPEVLARRGSCRLAALLRDGPRKGHGGHRGRHGTLARRNRTLHLAHRRGASGVRKRIRPYRLSGRPQLVPQHLRCRCG